MAAGVKKEGEDQSFDLTSREGVAGYMRLAKSNRDWDMRVDQMLEANGKKYPDFWMEVFSPLGVGHPQTLYKEISEKWESKEEKK